MFVIYILLSLLLPQSYGLALLLALSIKNILNEKNYTYVIWIFSTFFDLYHGNFVGISLLHSGLITAACINYQKSWEHLSPIVVSYYLLMILFAIEILMYFVTTFFDGNYSTFDHAFIPLKTILIYGAIAALKRVKSAA